jgi:hypothetical protein
MAGGRTEGSHRKHVTIAGEKKKKKKKREMSDSISRGKKTQAK